MTEGVGDRGCRSQSNGRETVQRCSGTCMRFAGPGRKALPSAWQAGRKPGVPSWLRWHRSSLSSAHSRRMLQGSLEQCSRRGTGLCGMSSAGRPPCQPQLVRPCLLTAASALLRQCLTVRNTCVLQLELCAPVCKGSKHRAPIGC